MLNHSRNVVGITDCRFRRRQCSNTRVEWCSNSIDNFNDRFISLLTLKFNLDGLITHEFAPENSEDAYQLAEQQRSDTMGILYDWTQRKY